MHDKLCQIKASRSETKQDFSSRLNAVRSFWRCRTAADDAPEDINAELGVGAVTADLELDAAKEAAEAQIVAAAGALGRYAPFVAAFCRAGCVKF